MTFCNNSIKFYRFNRIINLNLMTISLSWKDKYQYLYLPNVEFIIK